MTERFDWLDPWYPVAPEDAGGLNHQLAIEVGEGHVLKTLLLAGPPLRLIARRADTDDALFALPDGRLAEVHMTWRQSAEPDPRWPVTTLFASLDEWAEKSMRPLHEELREGD